MSSENEEWSDNPEGNWSEDSCPSESEGIMFDSEEPEKIKITFDTLHEKWTFGQKAFKPLIQSNINKEEYSNECSFIQSLFVQSVPNFMKLRGQRGQHSILHMIQTCYSTGLFTLSHSINQQIIPAIRYILNNLNKLNPKDPKRISVLRTITDAFLDCQQIQAREIFRMFGDLTNQTQTLDKQITYILMRQKETSLNEFISDFHMNCDLDHTKTTPNKQRAHLYSAYLDLIGLDLGMDGIESAREDRFLGETMNEIRNGVWAGIGRDQILKMIKNRLSIKHFIICVLSDINNQSDNADRLIDRNVIFQWVEENMTGMNKMKVFYDEERKEEYENQEPSKPLDKNKFQPFLSLELLIEMLEKMELIERK